LSLSFILNAAQKIRKSARRMLRALAGSWRNYHQVRDRALFRREIESVRFAADCLAPLASPLASPFASPVASTVASSVASPLAALDAAAQTKLTASLQQLDKTARTRRRNWRAFCSGAESKSIFGTTKAVCFYLKILF